MEKEEYVLIKRDHLFAIIQELLKLPMASVEGVVNFLRNSNEEIIKLSKEDLEKIKNE